MTSVIRPFLRFSAPTRAGSAMLPVRLRLAYRGRSLHNRMLSGAGPYTPATRSWHPPCKASESTAPAGAASDCHGRFRSRRQFGSSARRREWDRDHPRPGADTDRPSGWQRWDSTTKFVAIAVAGGAAYYVTHLEKVPGTGRWRFMSVDPRWEAMLAKQEHTAFMEEYKGRILPPNHPIVQQIRKVVAAILEVNNLGVLKGDLPGSFRISTEETWDPDATGEEFRESDSSGLNTREWNLLVVHDDKVVNAAAGHGNIIVFTGILPVVQDEQGLAAVLSHEIAHVVARHVSEKLSSMLVLNFVVYILGVIGLDPGFGNLFMEYLYALPNSRTQELEADKIGLQLAARACFDPRGAPVVQARLAELERRAGRRLNVSFLYTHPTGEKRIKLLTDALPEAYELRAASGACAHLQDDFDAFREAAAVVRVRQMQERV